MDSKLGGAMTAKNISDQYGDNYTIVLQEIENKKHSIVQKIGKDDKQVHMLLVEEIVEEPKTNYADDQIVLIKDPFKFFRSFRGNKYDV